MTIEVKIVGFAIAMFVLSQISERITNFIKLYLPVLFPHASVFETLKMNSQVDARMKKKHERIVYIISLIGGGITAGLFIWGFSIEKGKDDYELEIIKWIGEYSKRWWFYAIVTVFLSFGAKFWHDILDIIFLYKNAKRQLQDPTTYQIEDPEIIKNRLHQSLRDVVANALQANKHKLEHQDGLVALSIGYSSGGVPKIITRFDTEANAKKGLSELYYTDKYQFEHKILIEKVETGTVVAQSFEIGNAIYNASKPRAKGTAGYLFKGKFDNRVFVLSCFHVMASVHAWRVLKKRGKERILFKGKNGKGQLLGQLDYGMGPFLDAAITEVDKNVSIDLDSIPPIKKTGRVEISLCGEQVEIIGMKSGRVLGRIYDHKIALLKVRYANNHVESFTNCFSITKEDQFGNPTQKGDSGGLVYLEGGTALGMIIAGCERFAYAVKLSEIEANFGIEIIPKEDYLNYLKS